MSERLVLGQYYDADSWMHRLDPRTKLVSLVMIMIGVFMVKDLTTILIILGLVLLLILSTKVPFSRFLISLKIMMFLLLFTAFFQIIFNNIGTVLTKYSFTMTYFSLGISVLLLLFFIISKKFIRKNRLSLFLLLVVVSLLVQNLTEVGTVIFAYDIVVYDSGLKMAIFIVARIVILVLISSLLTLTTKPTDLNNGLEKLFSPLEKVGLRMSILAMMISIALRYIPTLINEAERILKAQASRGVDFNEGNFKDKVTQIISLLVPMFIISIKRSNDLANAMEARGYIPGESRTSLYELKYRFVDYLVMTFSVLFIVGAVFSRKYL